MIIFVSGASWSTRTRQSDCSRLSQTTVLSGAALKLAMASTYSSESKNIYWLMKLIVVIEGLQFTWYLQLHHRAAVLLPHPDWDALQQENRLCLPWWSRPGGVQVYFTAICYLGPYSFQDLFSGRCRLQKFCPQEFHNQYGHKINTATRPYSFIEFDTYIQVDVELI